MLDISDINESLLFYKLSRTSLYSCCWSSQLPRDCTQGEVSPVQQINFFFIPLNLVHHSGVASQCASPCWGHGCHHGRVPCAIEDQEPKIQVIVSRDGSC